MRDSAGKPQYNCLLYPSNVYRNDREEDSAQYLDLFCCCAYIDSSGICRLSAEKKIRKQIAQLNSNEVYENDFFCIER